MSATKMKEGEAEEEEMQEEERLGGRGLRKGEEEYMQELKAGRGGQGQHEGGEWVGGGVSKGRSGGRAAQVKARVGTLWGEAPT